MRIAKIPQYQPSDYRQEKSLVLQYLLVVQLSSIWFLKDTYYKNSGLLTPCMGVCALEISDFLYEKGLQGGGGETTPLKVEQKLAVLNKGFVK